MKTKRRPGQHADESAIEYLRRVVSNCDYEGEHLLEQLPSVDAVLEFFELWHTYNTDFWSGVLECIAEGDDPGPARAFIAKWRLGREWTRDVSDAAKLARTAGATP